MFQCYTLIKLKKKLKKILFKALLQCNFHFLEIININFYVLSSSLDHTKISSSESWGLFNNSLVCLQSYSMRNGILGLMGEIVVKVLRKEDLDATAKKLRDHLLDKLEVGVTQYLIYRFSQG